ncbi:MULTISPECIES: hypothetical protein [unclassified Endozoicomonas]|uniref:hypothetical protein n=1 Tax=unclassified Endozoicomonas TaxID=2644528 RepID=UPI003BB56FE5
MPKKRKPARRDTAAQELWNPKYRMKVCRDKTKYYRKEKSSKGRFDSGHFFMGFDEFLIFAC